MDWQKRATREKSLGQVYWKARKTGSTRSNFRVAVLVAFLFCALAAIDCYTDLEVLGPAVMKMLADQLADIGFALTTAITGFLIIGFLIFASITPPGIFTGLAKLDHKNTGISRLQFIFFNFLLVFIHYLAFLAVSILLKLGLTLTPTFINAVSQHVASAAMITWWFAVGLIALLLGWLTFLIMLLKSFIWNIYQTMLIIIVVGDDILALEKTKSSEQEV